MTIKVTASLLALVLIFFSGGVLAQDTYIKCPAGNIQTDVTTPLPDGWWSTEQGGKLSDAEVTNVGGRTVLTCIYKMTSTQVRVMRDAPSGMSCRASRDAFRCRSGSAQGSSSGDGKKTYEVDGQAVAKVPVRNQKGDTLTPGNSRDTSGPSVRTGASCPDLAMTGVEVRMLSRDPQGQYSFRLAAMIKNLGRADFTSGRGQQRVEKFEISQGGSPRRLGTSAFESVAAGSERVAATHDVLRWRTSQEFPPVYRFDIVYGPDISADGNSANDDCRLDNNSITITGEEINAIIRGSGI